MVKVCYGKGTHCMKSNELLSEVNKVEFENSLNHLIKELINWKTNNSFVPSYSKRDYTIRK